MGNAKWAGGVAAAAVLTFGSVASADVPIVKTEDTEVNIGAMLQVIGYGQILNDPFRNDQRAYLFMKEARLRLSGKRDWFSLNLETGLGPEEVIVAPTPGLSLGLLDLNADVRFNQAGTTYLKVGQFKVPYGREQLTYSGDLLFANRSVESLGFMVGRDVGVAVVSKPGMFTLIGGVFTGGGRNVPLRFLPEKISIPLLVGRVGVGTIEEDPFRLTSTARGAEKLEWGVFLNGLFSRDSLIGHSTVLNVKTADKSLLLNGNWNPFIGMRPFDQGKWYQVGGDAIVRVPVGSYTLQGEIQVDHANYNNRFGELALTGGRAQASVARGMLDVGLRYGMLISDPGFAAGTTPITGDNMLHEITPTVGLNFGDYMRLVADLPLLFNTPVVIEDQVGSYVLTDMPDQAAQLTRGATLESQTVVQGRLMFQAEF